MRDDRTLKLVPGNRLTEERVPCFRLFAIGLGEVKTECNSGSVADMRALRQPANRLKAHETAIEPSVSRMAYYEQLVNSVRAGVLCHQSGQLHERIEKPSRLAATVGEAGDFGDPVPLIAAMLDRFGVDRFHR